MDHFLEHYGLLAVYLGAATEGDGTVTLAGALAHLRYFPFLAALAAAWAGGLSIDWTLFAVGRLLGQVDRSARHLLAVLGVAVLTALVFGIVGIWVRRALSAQR